MSTPAPLPGCPVDRASAQLHSDAAQHAVAPLAEAANDSTHSEPDADDHRNPLWLLVIAGGCLFATMAALLALG